MAMIEWQNKYGHKTWIGYELPGGEIVCRWCITDAEDREDDDRDEEPRSFQIGTLTCSRCKRPLMAPDPITGRMNHLLFPPPTKKGRRRKV